jgi:hypothetical protein
MFWRAYVPAQEFRAATECNQSIYSAPPTLTAAQPTAGSSLQSCFNIGPKQPSGQAVTRAVDLLLAGCCSISSKIHTPQDPLARDGTKGR